MNNSRRYVYALLGLLTLLVRYETQAQTKYFVAANGNDTNNGHSISTPFKSISKINSLVLQPGDSVLFRRGDTFQGTLTIRQSGSASRAILVDAYGSGAKPTITGSVPVTTWTNVGGNIWQASCPSCGTQVTGLYRNDVELTLGRYPNTDAPNLGNLYIRSHVEKYQIASQTPLPAGIDWKGAEVVMRPTAWIIDRAVVDHQYGDALNLFNYSTYTPRDGSEFFFQNHPATLDRNGEWCYDMNTKTFRLYDAQSNPNNQLITATVLGRAIDLTAVSYISVSNIHTTQTLNTSIYAQNVSNLTLTNLDITNSGEDGVLILGAGNTIVMENSKLLNVNNNGIHIDPYQNVTFRNNTLRHIGAVAGRGKSGDGMYNGLQSAADQTVLIENNVIDSVGYNGITFSNNTTIQKNIISNYCITKVDGGGIYAWNGNKYTMSNIHILSNILYASPGAYEKALYQAYSIGIFMDDCVDHVEIKDNTVFNNTQWGVFLHGVNNIVFTGNTIFNNRVCQLVMYYSNSCDIRSNTVKQNIFFSKQPDPNQMIAQFESGKNDLAQYGSIDSNYYARPFIEADGIRGVYNVGTGGNFSLPEWQSFSGHDSHSKSSPITYTQYENNTAGGISRLANTFDQTSENWFPYSPNNNAEVVMDNTNRLDGGSLRVDFATPSPQSSSFMLAYNAFGAVTKGKTYLVRFDGVATGDKVVEVFIRRYSVPYELDKRYTVTLSTTRKSFELPFTVSDDEANTILVYQTNEDGQTFWLDNIRLQEGVPTRNDPDEKIRFFYNPTLKDSLITLTGIYRDVKNQPYSNQVILKPFTSIILLKDTPVVPAADLSLSLETDKRVLAVGELITFRLRVRNESNTQGKRAQWMCRLPANLQLLRSDGQPYSDNVMIGTVQQLAPYADTTMIFRARPTAGGIFRIAGQLITATSPDPDSRPDSGTGDGEDDMAVVDFRVNEGANSFVSIFESPNPHQVPLPAVQLNQPAPNPTKADLSLEMAFSRRTVALNDTLTCSLYITNRGGVPVSSVTIQNQLPVGLQFVNGTGWAASGQTLTTQLSNLAVGTTISVNFRVRVTQPGRWINQAQISASSMADPDSTPGNGFANGEDDQAQADMRVR